MPSINYQEDYLRRLRNRRYALGLLNAAFVEASEDRNWQAFGLLLQDIVAAHGDKQSFAKRAKISRQQLYRLFGKDANPTLKTLCSALAGMGLRLTISEVPNSKRSVA